MICGRQPSDAHHVRALPNREARLFSPTGTPDAEAATGPRH